VVVVVLGGLIWSAAAGSSVSAQRPHLFGGSLVLEDQKAPTVIDVATGQVTVRLDGVYKQVGAASPGDVLALPVQGGTMLINAKTGTFNLLGKDNYVVDSVGEGVGLGPLKGLIGASGLAAGPAAYIIRYAPNSTVSLVDQATVSAGARLERAVAVTHDRSAPTVIPRGFASLGGAVLGQPGSAAVADGDLWILVRAASGCQVLQLHPISTGNGLGRTVRSTLPSTCSRAALESFGAQVGAAWPGHVRLFSPDRPRGGSDLAVASTQSADKYLPVIGTTGTRWFLSHATRGWSVFGVNPKGAVIRQSALVPFGARADPLAPVESRGVLYSLDRASVGQPILWTIDPSNGAMVPVRGAATYPAVSPSERALFDRAQVLVDGPRVVFNNPGSLLAVVAFTDDSHAPVVVDKSRAVSVNATGPVDMNASQSSPKTGTGRPHSSVGQPKPLPVVQPVNQNATCRTTTQKPYAPQITSITPSSGSALIEWSYQLLDQLDCEPDSWSVQVKALAGGHQPVQPVQVVNGQTQIQFTGLRPTTTYRVLVTAYINLQSTPSAPATFTTAARGPDAPVAVHTVSDGKGNWLVSWTPCTSASCVVPAARWNVVGAACGGSFVGQPPNLQVLGNQFRVAINADGLGLLGDSVSFSVQGTLATGLAGNPTSDNACTQAWRPPNPSAITFGADGAVIGQTVTATLQVSTQGGRAVQAFGSNSTQFVYRIGPATVGPTTQARVTVPGLRAGQPYAASVQVYPTDHPGVSVSVRTTMHPTDLTWPNLAPAVGRVSDIPPRDTIDLPVAFPGYPPGPLTASWAIVCGNTSQQGANTPLTTGGFTVRGFNLDATGGSCQITASVSYTNPPGTPNPYGNTSSQPETTYFSVGTLPAYRFSAAFSNPCLRFCQQEQVVVSYDGVGQPAGDQWSVTLTGPARGHDPCAAYWPAPGATSSAPGFPLILNLPSDCNLANPGLISIAVGYRYLGQAQATTASSPLQGPGTTTTTTTTTSTTTTTTTSTTTTLPRCPSTTTTSTTAPCGSSSAATGSQAATPGSPGVAAGGPPPPRRETSPGPGPGAAQLASRELPAVRPSLAGATGDPDVRTALEVTPVVCFVAWCSIVSFRIRRHRIRSRQETGDGTR
jgi:hypothetical protein